MNDEQFAAILASMNGLQREAVLTAVHVTVQTITAMIANPEAARLADEATDALAAHLDDLIERHRP